MSWRNDTTTTSWCVLSSITLKYSYSHLWVCLFTLRVVPNMILVLVYHTSLNNVCCFSAVSLSYPFSSDVIIRWSKPVSSVAVSLANAEKEISEMINYSLNSETTNWTQVSVQCHADRPALIKKTKQNTTKKPITRITENVPPPERICAPHFCFLSPSFVSFALVDWSPVETTQLKRQNPAITNLKQSQIYFECIL